MPMESEGLLIVGLSFAAQPCTVIRGADTSITPRFPTGNTMAPYVVIGESWRFYRSIP